MAVIINNNIEKIEKNLEIDKEIIKESINALSEYEKGDFSLKINRKSSNNELNDLTSIINQMANNLENNIDNILSVFSDYSNNDYTKKVSTLGIKAHLSKLAYGVNDLGDSISALLSKSYEVGVSLENSSAILLSNVDVLNNSTNVAASSLEETSAALEEITSTIIKNTKNVNQISDYSNSLNSSAIRGQKLAQNTTSSMDEITNQVNLINEAISLIDQIAFQTNILSLNAAVEAATAGEAGKGFAVVAQEVRNLASSSAQAAKDIKELVENATKKAQEGKTASDEMINGYDSLLKDIKSSSEKIDEITKSSKEQENGIIQINDAINKLDQQTQNNANIANKTKEIAIETSKIANEIVSDVKSKEFIGKDSFK
ncbi:MAG: hypothetical protein HRT40_12655 [Campylobacteraceae bacterium]|nr:hypothetical protein [Campylobacteraceae bacterium]